MKKKRSQKTPKQPNLLPLLFVLIVFMISLFALRLPLFQKHTKKTSPLPENVQILNGLAHALDIKPELRDTMYWDWIEGNKRMPLMGREFIMGTVDINGIGQYKKLADQDLANVTFKSLAPINASASSYLKSQGFAESKINLRKTDLGVSDTEYFGYQNGDLKCVYRLSETTDPFGAFFCGHIDQHQWQRQQPFLPMFEKQFTDDPFAGFRVDKVDGDFATGTYYGAVEGYQWIAQKRPDGWFLLWNGQEVPMCETMQELQIPKSMYGNCYTDSNGTLEK